MWTRCTHPIVHSVPFRLLSSCVFPVAGPNQTMENVRDVVTELHIHVFVLVSQVTQYDLVSNQYIVKL